ncbi:MAG: M20 family metallopeptidase, partial [Anaerolineae bacterium]
MIKIDADYLLETLKESIRINSILPYEEVMARFFADKLRELGVEPEWHVVAEGRPNVYGCVKLGPSDKLITLTGHTDTVDIAENWLTDPFDPVIKDGKLYGLGSYDMKSGLVCALTAFKALIETPELHDKLGTVAFAATVDEEALGLGAKALLETKYGKSDAMLLGEPMWGDEAGPIPLGLTGKVLYKLTVVGRAAHGFYPDRGLNAVEAASKIIASLDQLNLYEHPEHGKGNYSTLKFEGGYQEYAIVVPERCEVIITRLTVPGENRASAVVDMQALIDSLDLDCEVTIETPAPFYEPYLIDENSSFVDDFKAAYEGVIGRPPVCGFGRGITDGNIYVADGGI